ncbi:hypothetical protein GALMADRAFT_145658 [Galerina marginata CBS 339.88]|uniref:Uncharacterized protein n=1 Tax=Galerina marginata (strain CBS 339.88) TaxID=685588 RepID=A0A067SED4_GALM3|nr:hypothetical protein GALMADRAFT_145658 [Galerina marginata CBS 339.88]
MSVRHKFYTSLPGISRITLPSSPVPHLLRSNIPPNEQEVSLICDAISMAKIEQECLDEKLKTNAPGRQRNRGSTMYKFKQVSAFFLDHKALLSPIRRIPPEILQEIFINTLPTPNEYATRLYMDDLPWALCQVSSTWRRTALGTSTLWRRVPTIDLDREYTKKRRYLDFLRELLSRSRDFPLDIHLHAFRFAGVTHPAIDVLMPHSTRWQKATLDIPCHSLVALEGVKGRLASLEILQIQSWNGVHMPNNLDVVVDTFNDAPRLRDVTLSGTYSTHFILPLSQLINYSQDNSHDKQIDNVIDLSTSLQKLTVCDLLRIDLNWSIVTLPQLVSLNVYFDADTNHQNLLDFLILPTLEELSITSHLGNLIPSVSSLISRKRLPSKLNKLSLRSQFANVGGELTALLQKIPLISHLNVSLPPAEDISSLIPGTDGPLVAPQLQICEFYVTDPLLPEETMRQIKLLASSRCELPEQTPGNFIVPGELQRLRTVYVHFDYHGLPMGQQGELHNWTATETSLTLAEMRLSLIDCTPELECRRPKILDFKQKDKALFILSRIENITVRRAEEIYHSGIHLSLKRLSYWFYPKHPKYKLTQFAKRILQKWDPIFEPSLNDFRWVIKDGSSLMYLSQWSALRSIKDTTNIVFGVRTPDIPASDLPWPSSYPYTGFLFR